jgi:hypothetical protein
MLHVELVLCRIQTCLSSSHWDIVISASLHAPLPSDYWIFTELQTNSLINSSWQATNISSMPTSESARSSAGIYLQSYYIIQLLVHYDSLINRHRIFPLTKESYRICRWTSWHYEVPYYGNTVNIDVFSIFSVVVMTRIPYRGFTKWEMYFSKHMNYSF